MADIAVSRAIPDALSSLEVRVLGVLGGYTLYADHTMHVGKKHSSVVFYRWKKDNSGRYVFRIFGHDWREMRVDHVEHLRIDKWLAEIELMKAVGGDL